MIERNEIMEDKRYLMVYNPMYKVWELIKRRIK